MIYIEFKSKNLKKRLETFEECVRKYGSDNAEKIIQRINEMRFSANLEEFRRIYRSARLHPLKFNREGQYAVDVKRPFHIIFVPVVNDEAYKEDGSLDLSKVTKIKIIEVGHYYD